MIEGVVLRSLEPHGDERGSLTELFRSDREGFPASGQLVLTVNLPGVVRAWHWHERQTDAICVISGRAVLPLYDRRPASPTLGALDEYVGDGADPFVLYVPAGVLHGYKTLGDAAALILNFPDRVYDAAAPDELRIPYNSPEVPFDWESRT